MTGKTSEGQALARLIAGQPVAMGGLQDSNTQGQGQEVADAMTRYKANPAVQGPVLPLPDIAPPAVPKQKPQADVPGSTPITPEETNFLKNLLARVTGQQAAQPQAPAPQPSLIDRLKAQEANKPQLVPYGDPASSGALIRDENGAVVGNAPGMRWQR